MGDHDIESEGEKISTSLATYSDKPTLDMIDHTPVTLTEEDVCYLLKYATRKPC